MADTPTYLTDNVLLASATDPVLSGAKREGENLLLRVPECDRVDIVLAAGFMVNTAGWIYSHAVVYMAKLYLRDSAAFFRRRTEQVDYNDRTRDLPLRAAMYR